MVAGSMVDWVVWGLRVVGLLHLFRFLLVLLHFQVYSGLLLCFPPLFLPPLGVLPLPPLWADSLSSGVMLKVGGLSVDQGGWEVSCLMTVGSSAVCTFLMTLHSLFLSLKFLSPLFHLLRLFRFFHFYAGSGSFPLLFSRALAQDLRLLASFRWSLHGFPYPWGSRCALDGFS